MAQRHRLITHAVRFLRRLFVVPSFSFSYLRGAVMQQVLQLSAVQALADGPGTNSTHAPSRGVPVWANDSSTQLTNRERACVVAGGSGSRAARRDATTAYWRTGGETAWRCITVRVHDGMRVTKGTFRCAACDVRHDVLQHSDVHQARVLVVLRQDLERRHQVGLWDLRHATGPVSFARPPQRHAAPTSTTGLTAKHTHNGR